MTRVQDTSKRGTRADRGLPSTPRPVVAKVTLFQSPRGGAPKGYAFNGRGDLINLRKRAKYRAP